MTPFSVTLNGTTHMVVRVFRYSNVGLLDNGKYVPLDTFGLNALND